MRWSRLSALLSLAAACLPAAAHSPMPGIGNFYAGMLHLWVVPAHAMAMVATGLWLGQRRGDGKGAEMAFLAAFVVGLAVGANAPWQRAELAVLAVTAAIALAVVSARDLPRLAVSTVVVIAGGLLGLDSQVDGLSGRPLWVASAGTALSVLLGLAWTLMICEVARRPWMKIGLRVIASWLAAAAILVLALAIAGPLASTPATA